MAWSRPPFPFSFYCVSVLCYGFFSYYFYISVLISFQYLCQVLSIFWFMKLIFHWFKFLGRKIKHCRQLFSVTLLCSHFNMVFSEPRESLFVQEIILGLQNFVSGLLSWTIMLSFQVFNRDVQSLSYHPMNSFTSSCNLTAFLTTYLRIFIKQQYYACSDWLKTYGFLCC